MWMKGQAAECYPGIYHHVLLCDQFIVDLQRGYRLVHSRNKSVIGLKWHRNRRTPKFTKLYYPQATALVIQMFIFIMLEKGLCGNCIPN